MKTNDVKTLAIKLGDLVIGYLTHYRDGKNVFIFDQAYIELGPSRPTLSLFFNNLDNEASTIKKLQKPYVNMHALPPFFSNLLPEGSLRDYIVSRTNIHSNDEFSMLAALGGELAGNIIATPIAPLTEDSLHGNHAPEIEELPQNNDTIRFSLAGIQIKFSMKHKDGRFNLSKPGAWGDFIIKTPSTIHKFLPENEYSMMRLAEAVGVDIPEIQLVKLTDLVHLPEINLPSEQYAYAIKRFDRSNDHRIHIEDFAQIIGIRAHDKYDKMNYDSMARIIFAVSRNKNHDLQEFIRRLTVNILLGNTDAHVKNWSLIYDNLRMPRLAPAYDIISSLGYISNREIGLNFGGEKNFYAINNEVVDRFIRHTKLPDDLIQDTIAKTVASAQESWPKLLTKLPITEQTLIELKRHGDLLLSPFKISL